MSKSVNVIIIVGNVGQNPEIHYINNNNKFATMQVATTRMWVDSATNERKSETEWHSVVVYSSGLVNIIEKYIKKGSKLYIRGRIKTYSWVDKKTEMKRYDKRIVLDGFDCDLVILDKKDIDASYDKNPKEDNHENHDSNATDDYDENLPF